MPVSVPVAPISVCCTVVRRQPCIVATARMSPAPDVHFTAVVLAGSRSGGDPLARAAGVSHKALAQIAGRSMLSRVLDALREARTVDRMVICGLSEPDVDDDRDLRGRTAAGEFQFLDSRATPSASVLYAMEQLAEDLPLLVTTADHALLTTKMVDHFCEEAAISGSDVAVGLVRNERVRLVFPTAPRASFRFRDAVYRGCNLFGFLTATAQHAPAKWMRVESDRKRPWRILGHLGVGVLLRYWCRRLTLEAAMQLAGQRLGVRVCPVVLPYAEAGFDVDTLAQHELAEAALRARDAAHGDRGSGGRGRSLSGPT